MKIKSNNIISSIIAAIMFLLFKEDQKDTTSTSPCATMPTVRCINIDESTINSLYKGEWIVLSDKYLNVFHSQMEPYCKNIAILSMDSVKKVELAVRLGIKNLDRPVLLKDGKIILKNKSFNIKEYVSFTEIIDLYIYCWAVDIRKIISSANDISIIADKFLMLTLKMIFEVTGFYITK